MSRTRYQVSNDAYPHFFTCTIVDWLPIFTRPESVQIIFDSWNYMRKENRMDLFAYVILENHLHFIAKGEDLAKQVANFKSYTARQLIDLLKKTRAETLLEQLAYRKASYKLDRNYQLWQEGSKPKQLSKDEMMIQKTEYIHINPVKRGYVDEPIHWRYSSARNYAGMEGLIEVTTEW